MHHMYGNWGSSLDWLWISLMTVLWIIVLGAFVYGAVRMGLHHKHDDTRSAPQ
jgi:hypothetical protein